MWSVFVRWFKDLVTPARPPRWVVQWEGVVIAELDDARFEDMFWFSYLVVPKPNPWFETDDIMTGPFWERFPQLSFVDANSGRRASTFPAGFHRHPGPLPGGRLHLRAMQWAKVEEAA